MQLAHFSLVSSLFFILLQGGLSNAAPATSVNNKTPTPTYPFTLAAFISPYPLFFNSTYSPGLNGVVVRAFNGSFYVDPRNQIPATDCGGLRGKNCPAGNETVFFVDSFGQAWLDSADPQQVYLDTRTGILGYRTSVSSPPYDAPPGAYVLNFLHLGHGTVVAVPIPGSPNYYNAGPGTFVWPYIYAYWALCPATGGGYQVFGDLGGNLNSPLCLGGAQLVALDWTGNGAAAGEYL